MRLVVIVHVYRTCTCACMLSTLLCDIYHVLFIFFRPKHLTKVHMWAGISKKGKTGICIFEGIMKKELFVSILEGTLLPLITDVYPEEYRFMQDNDPKHTSG